jgi:hypothetical protein
MNARRIYTASRRRLLSRWYSPSCPCCTHELANLKYRRVRGKRAMRKAEKAAYPGVGRIA